MASIIADGQHVNFEVVKMSYQLMKERLFLITDAVTECHIGPYQHQLERVINLSLQTVHFRVQILPCWMRCRTVLNHCGIPLS